MSTFDDLTTQLNAISVDIVSLQTDVATLLAKLAAVPPAGLTAAQQTALDAAVATAQNIDAKLKALDTTTHPPVTGPMPVITAISPTSGPVAGNTPVTLTGSGFTGATVVSFDNVNATDINVVSDTEITAVTPAGVSGAQNVVVATPEGSTAPNTLYTYTTSVPTLASIDPTSGPVAGGTLVTLTGTGFTGATGVTVGGVSVTPFNVVNDTTITFTTAAGSTTGSLPVVVSTPAGVTDGTVMYTAS